MTHKIAYSYNENQEFIAECKAWESPLEKDVFLLPAHATFTKPLPPKKNNKIVFNGKNWEYQEIPKPKPKPKPVVLTNIEKRKQEYSKEISNSDFQEAYFEKEFEGKSEKLKALQEKRLEIKFKYPKK